MDNADYANERMQQAIDEALAARKSKQVARESATHCNDCDDEIPETRRQAVPGCQLCIDCQEYYEKRNGAAQ